MHEAKTVAILGGSFDPPTIAHVQIACEIYNNFADVDEVWFIPCGDGRGDKNLRTQGLHRMKMLQLILRDLIDECVPIKINDIEVKNAKYYPTWDLLLALKESNPEYNFIFCLGTDLIESLKTWDYADLLLKEVNFIVIQRPEYNPDQSQYPVHYRVLETIIDVSSTKVRNRIREQIESKNKICLGISGLTTTSVIKYIIEHNLYQNQN